MSNEDIGGICLLLILLALSAFFSSAETAYSTVNRIRIKTMAEEGNSRAVTVTKITEHYSRMISAVLIGNNLVNIFASSLVTRMTIGWFGNRGVGIASGILTLVILIFCEVTPKTMASALSEKLALLYARPIWFLMTVARPLIFLVNGISKGLLILLRVDPNAGRGQITEQELRSWLDVGEEAGVLEDEEHSMLMNVFDFWDAQAKDVMVPRADMVMVDTEDTYETVNTIFRRTKFSRLPVYEEDRANIIGIINFKDFIYQPKNTSFQIKDIMYEPYYTIETKGISDLLTEMRENLASMSVVVDEYGAAVGIVTIEDLLEELVGEIRDEYDDDEQYRILRKGKNTWIIRGSVNLDDVNDTIGTHLASEDYDSIGGYIIGKLERLPEAGEEVMTDEGEVLRVERIDKNRILKVRLTIPEKPGDKEENSKSDE